MSALAYPTAVDQVKSQVLSARTSFHTGMAMLPKPRREAMYGLYAFCRTVDDIADDSPSPEIAAKALDEWRIKIHDAFHLIGDDAITTVLIPAIDNFNLIEKDFQSIIDGMAMDSTAIIAPDMTTLDLYCDRVASAVGRISIRIFGVESAQGLEVAYYLGRAFQLTNILRDLAEDASRGRLYLPQELLQKHGITSRNPSEVLRSQKLGAVCQDLASQAHQHYEMADAYMRQCEAEAIRPARLMREYYGELLALLIKSEWKDPSHRVNLPKWKKARLVIKGILK